jgi:MarR family transcriptional regulator for hemolysin
MPPLSPNREFAFLLNDVARLLRTYADHKAAQLGITRAQWAVLVRIDRSEGLNQSELAETLDLQPITLTRLLDKLSDSGLIERRPDPDDRRAKRLYLKPAARPLLEPNTVDKMLAKLSIVKENLRRLIHARDAEAAAEERRYG